MKIQKRLAGQLMKASSKRVKFDNQRLVDINEAITKSDVRRLIDEKAITKVQEKGVSRGRARKTKTQKAKGKRKGLGSREGKKTARTPKKETWMNKIRSQRKLLKSMKESGAISKETFRNLYRKSKGGFFRSQRHIKIFLEDQELFLKKKAETKVSEPKVEVKKKTTKKKQVTSSQKAKKSE